MEWDTTDTTATITGTASAFVSSTVSYPNSRTLLLDIIQDFTTGTNSVTISDLSFRNFLAVSPKSNLEMEIGIKAESGDTSIKSTDTKEIRIVSASAPTVTDIQPDNGPRSSTTNVTITGADFIGAGFSDTTGGTATAVHLDDAASTALTGVSVVDNTKITATVPASIVLGQYNVIVTTPSGSNVTSAGKFSVGPTVTSISSSFGTPTATLDVTITGSDFVGTASTALASDAIEFTGGDISFNAGTFTSSTSLTANITIAGTSTGGARDIKITNPGGEFAVSKEKFVIVKPTLTLAQNVGNAGSTIAYSGQGYKPGTTHVISFGGAGTAAFGSVTAGLAIDTFTSTSEGKVPSGSTFSVPSSNDASKGVVISPTPASNIVDTAIGNTIVGTGTPSALSAGAQPVFVVGGLTGAVTPSTVVAGGLSTITASGGTQPYTFAIKTNNSGASITAVNATTHTFTAGLNVGTSTVDTIEVTDSSNPAISFTKDIIVTRLLNFPTPVNTGVGSTMPLSFSLTNISSGTITTDNVSEFKITAGSSAIFDSVTTGTLLSGTGTSEIRLRVAGGIGAVTAMDLEPEFVNFTVTEINGAGLSAQKGSFFIPTSLPVMGTITPNTGTTTVATAVTLTGSNFVSVNTVTMSLNGASTVLSNLNVKNNSELTAVVPSGLAVGTYTVLASSISGVATSGVQFVIPAPLPVPPSPAPRPIVTSINPVFGVKSTSGSTNINVTISGGNFTGAGTAVSFSGTGITATTTAFVDSTKINAQVTLDVSAATGARVVSATNLDGQSSTETVLFHVLDEPTTSPLISTVSPTSAFAGSTLNLTINGANFQTGAGVGLSGSDITVNFVTFVSSLKLVANITVPASAVLSARDITVTNADNAFQTKAGLFTIVSPLLAGGGFNYDFNGTGLDLIDGSNDAYDNMYKLLINGTAFTEKAVTFEDANREIVTSPQTISGLSVKRKAFVPADGSFARYLEIITNNGSSTAFVTVKIDGDLGSNGQTLIVNTSDGDTTLENTDRYLVTDDSADGMGTAQQPSDPALSHVFDGLDGVLSIDSIALATDELSYEWNSVSIPAGNTIIIMHFAVQASNRALANNQADSIQGLQGFVLDGLTADEQTQIQNWSLKPRMVSDANQVFMVNDSTTVISPITIIDANPSPLISAASDIRIKIPAGLNMTWDTSDTSATITGGAASKVSSTVSYEGTQTVLLDVTGTFTVSESIKVADLGFTNFTAVSDFSKLQLVVGTFTVSDSRTKRIISDNPPTVTNITPSKGISGLNVPVTINGTDFFASTAGKLDDSASTALTNLQVLNNGTITATVPTSSVAVGDYNVVITTPAGSNGTSTPQFRVLSINEELAECDPQLYVVNAASSGTQTINLLNTVSGKILNSFAVPENTLSSHSSGLAFNGQNLFYTSGDGNNNVFALNPTTGSVTASFTGTMTCTLDALGSSRSNIFGLCSDTNEIFVMDLSGNIVSSFATTTTTLAGGLTFGGTMGALKGFVTNDSSDSIFRFDAGAKTTALLGSPATISFGLGFSECSKLLFAGNDTDVEIFDTGADFLKTLTPDISLTINGVAADEFDPASNQPVQPVGVLPSDGAVGVLLAPTLTASAFTDPDSDTHTATQWQISSISLDYSIPVFDSGLISGNGTATTIPANTLAANTRYFWHVRYQDSTGVLTRYSRQKSFTTRVVGCQDVDMNCDGSINVSDAQILINGILGVSNPNMTNSNSGDIDGGGVSVTDLQRVINAILGQ